MQVDGREMIFKREEGENTERIEGNVIAVHGV
jgi:hypothetical protein